MSHVAIQTTKPGEPMFADRTALEMAVGMLGCVIVETNVYRWWGSDHGRSVSDYPLPAGMKSSDLGRNAAFVIRLSDEKRALASARNGGVEPYDVGIVEDPNNPGCYMPMYDFFLGGYGVDDVMGAPITSKGGEKTMLLPKLKQHYDMCCDALAARESGDTIEFLNAKAAHEKYPRMFPKTEDESTWVSIATTDQRVGVH